MANNPLDWRVPGVHFTFLHRRSAMDDTTLAFLLTHQFQQAFQQWDARQPARTGLHASSVLESDADFCTRQHVLAEAFPAERQQKEQFWRVLAMFANGWSIHKKWQDDLLKPTGMVVKHIKDDADGWPEAPEYELDLTHVDPDTSIHYSPDVILEFAGLTLPIEIKGINTLDFQGTPALYKADGFDYVLVEEGREGVKGATLEEAMARNKSIRGAVPQLNLYLHLQGLTKAPNNRGIILAEDKNTQDFMLWIWTYDPELVKAPLAKADHVKVANAIYRIDNTLPERLCNAITDSRAKRCPFRYACFSR